MSLLRSNFPSCNKIPFSFCLHKEASHNSTHIVYGNCECIMYGIMYFRPSPKYDTVFLMIKATLQQLWRLKSISMSNISCRSRQIYYLIACLIYLCIFSVSNIWKRQTLSISNIYLQRRFYDSNFFMNMFIITKW